MFAIRSRITAWFCFLLLSLFAIAAVAQDLNSVKSRMLERKGSISALKNQGAVGEGNDGYLHLRKSGGNAQTVVKAENADRRVVYQAISKKQGVPVGTVASRRAIQLAGIASPGHWVQKKDGTWYRK